MHVIYLSFKFIIFLLVIVANIIQIPNIVGCIMVVRMNPNHCFLTLDSGMIKSFLEKAVQWYIHWKNEEIQEYRFRKA